VGWLNNDIQAMFHKKLEIPMTENENQGGQQNQQPNQKPGQGGQQSQQPNEKPGQGGQQK
jgi:hypothetical protein